MPRIQYNQSARDAELADALRRQAQNLQSTQIQEAGGRVLATNPLAALNTALSPIIAGYYDRKASEQEQSAADKLAKLYADPRTTPQQIAAAQIEQGDLSAANEAIMRTIRQASKDDIPAGATPEELPTGAKGYRMPDGSFYETSPAMSAYQANVMDVEKRRERGLADSGSKFTKVIDEKNREVVMPADVAAGYKQQEYAPAVVGPSMQDKANVAIDQARSIDTNKAAIDLGVAEKMIPVKAEQEYATKVASGKAEAATTADTKYRDVLALIDGLDSPEIDKNIKNIASGGGEKLNMMMSQVTGKATPNMKARAALRSTMAPLLAYAQKLPGAQSDRDVINLAAQVGIIDDPSATQGEIQAAVNAARISARRIAEKLAKTTGNAATEPAQLAQPDKPKMSREEFMRMRLGR